MAELIVDASITAAWCFPSEQTQYTDSVLWVVSIPTEALAPRLWAYEIRNSVLMGMKRGRIAKAHAESFLGLLNGLPIRLRSRYAAFDPNRCEPPGVGVARFFNFARRMM